jgi:Tol biopolymer transport system component
VRLRSNFTNAVYAPANGEAKSGRLLFRIGETLMSQPFDLSALRLAGEMSPVAERVGQGGNAGNGAFSVSAGGILVYGEGVGERRELRMTWFDRAGKPIDTPGSIADVNAARISPNAKQVVYPSAAGGRTSLYVQQTAGGPPTQIVSGTGQNGSYPVWSPDATKVVFSKLGPKFDLYLKHLDGEAREESLHVGGLNARATDWSADGKWIVYEEQSEKTNLDLWLLPVAGDKPADRNPIVFLETPANERSARFSPDGRWMAYAQEEAGRSEVFVQAISPEGPATGIKYRVSSAGGANPFWRRDGKELYFQAPGQAMARP